MTCYEIISFLYKVQRGYLETKEGILLRACEYVGSNDNNHQRLFRITVCVHERAVYGSVCESRVALQVRVHAEGPYLVQQPWT